MHFKYSIFILTADMIGLKSDRFLGYSISCINGSGLESNYYGMNSSSPLELFSKNEHLFGREDFLVVLCNSSEQLGIMMNYGLEIRNKIFDVEMAFKYEKVKGRVDFLQEKLDSLDKNTVSLYCNKVSRKILEHYEDFNHSVFFYEIEMKMSKILAESTSKGIRLDKLELLKIKEELE